MARRSGSVVMMLLLACGPVVGSDDAPATTGSGDTGSTGGPTSATTAVSSTSVGSTSSTGTGTTSTTSDPMTVGEDDDDTGLGSGANFLCHHCSPDGGQVVIECDIFAQDCPDGEKCMPWANDGGATWNATRCSPLERNAAEIGEPCNVEGSGVSGIDDCVGSSMCFGVDPTTNTGTCGALCTGTVTEPSCPDALTCSIFAPDVLPICLQACDPLAPDCGVDTCVIDEDTGDAWCIPAVLVGETVQGEPCNDPPFACSSAFVCAPGGQVLDCVEASCCTTRCDPLMPEPCPGEASGETCLPLAADPAIGFCGVAG